jgi:hypothetical protein
MLGRSISTVASLLAVAPLLGACQNDPAAGLGLNTGEAVALAGVKVELPPPPSFSDLDQPQQTPDGKVTVFGLRKNMDKYLGKDTTVKAYLLDVYVCPVCPKGKTCRLCEQPHFFVGDKPDTKKEKALMVVDYLAPKQKPPVLTVGKQYEVQGTFQRNSPTGFAASDGLLVFTHMVDDKNLEFIAPAAQLEQKAIAGQADELAKALKARSEALQKKK